MYILVYLVGEPMTILRELMFTTVYPRVSKNCLFRRFFKKGEKISIVENEKEQMGYFIS